MHMADFRADSRLDHPREESGVGRSMSGDLSRGSAAGVIIPADEDCDEALMAQIRAGSQAAYRRLVHRHLKRTYALARRLTGNEAEAEDVVQDAFLQVWQRRTQWSDDGGARFTTWLYRVVVNRCIDHKRRPVGQDLESVAEPSDSAPDAVSTIHRRQVAARLLDAQNRLTPQQRAAVTLFYYENLSNADIAAVMQISVGAVESLLKRARQQLRLLLRAGAQAARDSFDDG
ncbi:RNA polymerase sigma-70 factor, ECF subfamily [Azospirillum oryzae]|uniref:RNA polymerase sigma-70 factor, ECF subfamily n=2 Tax=Azospirillum oryzae TaxID=286727 RepID=A0A1X7DQC1_9PROT|nr:RNA polymerase sigma-70 factor, ECF subfamily [Azospirillum oryzae]